MHPKIAVVEPAKATRLSKVVSQAAGSLARTAAWQVVRVPAKDLRSTLSTGVDLVLADLMLPEKDGIQVLEALKSEAPSASVPLLILSTETLTSEDITERIQTILSKMSQPAIPTTPERERGEWRSIELDDVVKGMGITQSTMAQIIGTSERNLARWVTRVTAPRAVREAKVQELKYIYYLLNRALKEAAIPRYLSQPNPALKGRTPVMALREGDFHSVEADLQQLIEGVYV